MLTSNVTQIFYTVPQIVLLRSTYLQIGISIFFFFTVSLHCLQIKFFFDRDLLAVIKKISQHWISRTYFSISILYIKLKNWRNEYFDVALFDDDRRHSLDTVHPHAGPLHGRGRSRPQPHNLDHDLRHGHRHLSADDHRLQVL